MLRAARVLIPLVLLAACASNEEAPADPRAAQSAAAARGFAYASEVCAACHAVAANDRASPDPHATPFVVIANLPGMTPTALTVWLHSSHPTMPNLIVAPEDRADLAAYLDSIKQGGGAT